ncbi:hypothetical protein OIE66_24035 [Nonomuraea sp. NBC_01738]|uniref:hypothetical protein n=1 Tax=Nonomuraea sp. NBC_01738 TaxID=2976003 RepID=UPI002E0F7841|nr:hypothetical protein OIE66_24035 [Nonomuraea sp. NBC_01738]
MRTDLVESALRHGLRIATLLAASAIVFGLGLSNLLRNVDRYEPALVQFGALALLGAVLAGEAVLLARGRAWGRLRLPVVALVVAAEVLSYTALPAKSTSTGVDWVFGAANWVGVAVLLDRPLRECAGFLMTHEVTAVLHLFLFDHPTRGALARFATGSVTVVGFPLCVVVVASLLHRLSVSASAAHLELERVRTADAAAAEAHQLRLRRYGELSATAIPLLEGLADRSLDPEDAEVQRECAIEAARMRRLMAETNSVADALLHELRHCAEVADRKGVAVELDTRGRWPEPPPAVRRDLTEAALTVLATASSRARVTVVGTGDLLSVSVVADCVEVPATVPSAPGVHVEALHHDEQVWMEARWQPTS